MLKVIYHVNCEAGASSISGMSTLHHANMLRVVRGCGNLLECLTLQVSGSNTMTWDTTALDASLPLDATIISVHCFTQRIGTLANPLIGLTLARGKETDVDLGRSTFHFRVYGGDARPDAPLDVLMQDMQELDLDYVPSCLTSIIIPGARERGLLPGAFILSGSKRELCVYAQHAATRLFSPVPEAFGWCSYLPPSFPKLRTQVICVDVVYRPGGVPVAAFGCEDGSVLLTVGGVEQQRAQLDGPISCVALFAAHTQHSAGRSPRQELWADRGPLVNWSPHSSQSDVDWGSVSAKSLRTSASAANALNALRNAHVRRAASASPDLSLCVGGAVGFAMVFEKVEQFGLERAALLPSSDEHDSVLSVAAADFNTGGGYTCLALGTYGGSILVYSRSEQTDQWSLEFSMAFGPPVYMLDVLRRIDIIPFLLVSSGSCFAVVAAPLSRLERLLQDRLDEAAKLYV